MYQNIIHTKIHIMLYVAKYHKDANIILILTFMRVFSDSAERLLLCYPSSYILAVDLAQRLHQTMAHLSHVGLLLACQIWVYLCQLLL